MNFALALSSNRVAGVHADLTALLAANDQDVGSLDPDAKDRMLEDKILHMNASDRTRAAIMAQITAPPDQQQASLRQIGAKAGGKDALGSLRYPLTKPNAGLSPLPDTQVALAAGLLFGSPEFQRR
jgi:hypothetical protein